MNFWSWSTLKLAILNTVNHTRTKWIVQTYNSTTITACSVPNPPEWLEKTKDLQITFKIIDSAIMFIELESTFLVKLLDQVNLILNWDLETVSNAESIFFAQRNYTREDLMFTFRKGWLCLSNELYMLNEFNVTNFLTNAETIII